MRLHAGGLRNTTRMAPRYPGRGCDAACVSRSLADMWPTNCTPQSDQRFQIAVHGTRAGRAAVFVRL